MHELAVTKSIIDEIRRVAERESIRPKRAHVSVGELTTFKPDPIRYYAGIITRGDAMLEGLELEIALDPGTVRCGACGSEGRPASESALACSSCGSTNVSVLSGNDVVIEKVVGDV